MSSDYRVYAKVQKLGKRGWNAGREINIETVVKRIKNGLLPEEDQALGRYIKIDSYHWTGIESDFACGLIGHPNVYWHSGEKAEVIEGEIALNIEEKGNSLRLTLIPKGLSAKVGSIHDDSVFLERVSDRLIVYPIKTQHRRLLSALAEDVIFPKKAKSDLFSTLGHLSEYLPLQSDHLAIANQNTQEGDPKPVIRLKRSSSSLLCEVGVMPLGAEGPFFQAGEGAALVSARMNEKLVQAKRDLKAETSAMKALLKHIGDLASIVDVGVQVELDRITAYELLSRLQTLKNDDLTILWPEGDPLNLIAERDVRDFKLNFSSSGEWFEMRGYLDIEGTEKLQLATLLKLLEKAEGRFIELDQGQVLALSDRLLKNLQSTRDLAKISKNKIEIAPMGIFAIDDWVNAGGKNAKHLKTDQTINKQLKALKESYSLSPRLPRTLKVELRDYQKEGFRWLMRLAHWGAGACLADDMGLGKTLQVLALLLCRAKKGPALVVAPTSVCSGWMEQTERFAPTLKLKRYGEGDRDQMLSSLGPYDLLVMSYGLMVQDIDKLKDIAFDTVVLDESQAIKNATTKRAKAAIQLKNTFRIVMTGTPVENHLGEIWSQMNFLNPGLLGSQRSFEERFAKPIQRDGNKKAAQSLKMILRPFILRRTKTAVLDELPEKTEITIRVNLSVEEAAVYETIRKEALARLKEEKQSPKDRMQVLADLMRLRRAACHPKLVDKSFKLNSAKLIMLMRLAEDFREGGHRALVFSQFVDHLSLVRKELDVAKIAYQYLDGSTSPKKRQAAIDAFREGEGDFFLISLKAGGFGLNLTDADYVVHLDPWWNPAVEDQASDRVHRIGQKRPVTVYRLVAENTVEERIIELHQNKRELAEDLLSGTHQQVKLNLEELKKLLVYTR